MWSAQSFSPEFLYVIFPCLGRLARVSYNLCMCQDNIKQKNFMLLVTETNHGLAYDMDVKSSFETFYDIIFVTMITKTLLKETPQKSVF